MRNSRLPSSSGGENDIYIIAEMACSHEGDISLGKKIIEGAGSAGADAVQFQIWSLKDMVVPHHPDYGLLTRLELSHEEWRQLYDFSRERYPDMDIIACVYERSSVDFAEQLGVDAYKIHSADISNPYLLSHVAQVGKRTDLSIGASTLCEIQDAIQELQNNDELAVWLMYGFQVFPTPTDAISLKYMMKLAQLFELPVGYQDHCDGGSKAAYWLPAAAAGMGVDILEKHITHDRSFKGVDHEAALNPDEFKVFVEMIREIAIAKGRGVPEPFTPEEERYRKNSKKSIVARHEIPATKQLDVDDLLFMRADEIGLPPDNAGRVIGRQPKRRIEAYELITEHDIQ